jgi:hypothetical protein
MSLLDELLQGFDEALEWPFDDDDRLLAEPGPPAPAAPAAEPG